MREKMYAMIRLLVEHCLEKGNIVHDERAISNFLLSRGFQPEDIYDTMGWLQQPAADREEPDWPSKKGRAVRVMHPEEHLAYTPAAQGLLHRLYQKGVLDDVLREEVIQRCVDINEDEIGIGEVKTITLLVLLKERREMPGEALLKLFEDENLRPTN